MNKSQTMEPCPVCGFYLEFVPWHGLSAAYEMCPCCLIQFGYDDAAGGSIGKRQEIYLEWRQHWIDAGMEK